ncbi:MAG: hypothetical protein AAB676_06570 [Verrucomicrobiota bacterium]|mgnify:CR=1 FL=1
MQMPITASRLVSTLSVICAIVLAVFAWPAKGQVVLSQVDDFEADLRNWSSGAGANPVPPSRALDVGPGGTGDDAMRIRAIGGGGAGRALVALNKQSQWSGDYLSAGVTSITLGLNNVGAGDLTMRLAFQGADNTTWFVSTLGYNIPAGSGWRTSQFSLAEGDLTRVQGTQSYGVSLGNVTEMRILHSTLPDFRGTIVVGNLLVDNIAAVPEPAASVAALALAAAGTIRWLRRRAQPA